MILTRKRVTGAASQLNAQREEGNQSKPPEPSLKFRSQTRTWLSMIGRRLVVPFTLRALARGEQRL